MTKVGMRMPWYAAGTAYDATATHVASQRPERRGPGAATEGREAMAAAVGTAACNANILWGGILNAGRY